MTMVSATMTSTPTNRNGVSLRKTNKPLMEKRRRARINDSLSQLKSLVIHSSKKDSSQFSKLEKADILELTVKHLRGLQQVQQHQPQMIAPLPQPPTNVTVAPTTDAQVVNGKYRAGFVECANQVISYLNQSQGLSTEARTKVISHLGSCLQVVHTTTPAPHPLAQQQQMQQQQQQQHPRKLSPQQIQLAPSSSNPSTAQIQMPPNNTASILAAAAGASMNPSLNATTQLPNGQIIQIVSSGNSSYNTTSHLPHQNFHHQQNIPSGLNLNHQQQQQPSIPSSHATLIPVLPQAAQPSNSNCSVSITSTSSSVPTAPINTQTSTPSYAQPLHIQIPPILSPVLIKNHPHHHQKIVQSNRHHNNHNNHQQYKQQVDQPKDIISKNTNSSATITPHSLQEKVNDNISSSNSISINTSLPYRAPSPQQRLSTSPPSSLYPGHPKARAQKQLNFFNSLEQNKLDDINIDKFSTNTHSQRYEKDDLTPPPSSASSNSSCSESENTSPLNLSQSPPSFARYNKVHKRHNFHHHNPNPYAQKSLEGRQQQQHFQSSTITNNNITAFTQSQNQNSRFLKVKEENNNIQPMVQSQSEQMESRKCQDFPSNSNTNKLYWSYMEEDRHCTVRHQNTPSPASSVGEDKVWRPW